MKSRPDQGILESHSLKFENKKKKKKNFPNLKSIILVSSSARFHDQDLWSSFQIFHGIHFMDEVRNGHRSLFVRWQDDVTLNAVSNNHQDKHVEILQWSFWIQNLLYKINFPLFSVIVSNLCKENFGKILIIQCLSKNLLF